MLISDQQYWVFDGESFFAPQSLSSLGLPDYVDKLDDAFVWGKNGKTYFFYQNLYWRFNEATKTMDSGKAIEILFVLVDVFFKIIPYNLYIPWIQATHKTSHVGKGYLETLMLF